MEAPVTQDSKGNNNLPNSKVQSLVFQRLSQREHSPSNQRMQSVNEFWLIEVNDRKRLFGGQNLD